jgi:hypothetical protein
MCHWQHGNNIASLTLILVLLWRAGDAILMCVQVVPAMHRILSFAVAIASEIGSIVGHAL